MEVLQKLKDYNICLTYMLIHQESRLAPDMIIDGVLRSLMRERPREHVWISNNELYNTYPEFLAQRPRKWFDENYWWKSSDTKSQIAALEVMIKKCQI